MSSIRCRIGGKRARPMASFVGSFRIFRWGAVRVVKMATGVLARNLSTTFAQSVIAGAMSTARANIIVCKSARVGRLRAMACASMPRPTTRSVAPRIRGVLPQLRNVWFVADVYRWQVPRQGVYGRDAAVYRWRRLCVPDRWKRDEVDGGAGVRKPYV